MAEFKECEVIMRLSPKVGYDPTEGICVAAEKVAELVRCKDCKLFDPEHEGGIGSCGLDMNVTANDYCSKAERKYEVGE